MHLGRMREAIESLKYSLALSASVEYEAQKDSTLLRLVKAHASLVNIDGAERYTKQLITYIQDKEQRKNQELIAFVETKNNLEEKSRVNQSLAAELVLVRQDLDRTQLYLRFAIAGAVLLLLSLLVVFKRFGAMHQP